LIPLSLLLTYLTEMAPNKKTTGLNTTIDLIIDDLCQKHQGDNLEKDIIALFEDIIRFFAGREEDFISFDELTSEQKEELYNEITTIINLLKKLGQSVDKQEAIKILSQNLIGSFSKKSRGLVISHEQLSKSEELRLKKEFSIITIQNLYKEQQQKVFKQYSKLKEKDLEKISEKINQINKLGMSFSNSLKKTDRSSISKTR